METVKDILHFLNKLGFIDYIDSDIYEKLKCMKQCLVGEFKSYIISKLTECLNIVDNIAISITNGDLDFRIDETDKLRTLIMYLIGLKKVVIDDPDNQLLSCLKSYSLSYS